jgi:hypothetical protein
MFKWLSIIFKRLIEFILPRKSRRQNERHRPPLHGIPKLQPEDGDVEIREDAQIAIIGPRSCGKTTFIGSLLSCPRHNDFLRGIDPQGLDSMKFMQDAKRTLPQSLPFLPTPLVQTASEIKQITFSIKLGISEEDTVKLAIACSDYSGEMFSKYFTLSDTTIKTYIDAVSQSASSILLLFSALEFNNDEDYANIVSDVFRRIFLKKWKGRIAFGLTKCEEIMVYSQRHRLGSEGLIRLKFPLTLRALTMACEGKNILIGYFSMSSFGMMGYDSTGNVKYVPNPANPTQYEATVEDPEQWLPFGLFAPLYWLSTAKAIPEKYQN